MLRCLGRNDVDRLDRVNLCQWDERLRVIRGPVGFGPCLGGDRARLAADVDRDRDPARGPGGNVDLGRRLGVSWPRPAPGFSGLPRPAEPARAGRRTAASLCSPSQRGVPFRRNAVRCLLRRFRLVDPVKRIRAIGNAGSGWAFRSLHLLCHVSRSDLEPKSFVREVLPQMLDNRDLDLSQASSL